MDKVSKLSTAPFCLRSVATLQPRYSYTNDEIAQALNLPALPRICKRIGIHSRKTFLPLDLKTGRMLGGSTNFEVEIAESVAKLAIEKSKVSQSDISVFHLVSCTIQHGKRIHFELSSHELVHRLGLPNDVFRFENDAGCDGFVHTLHTINSLFRLQPGKHALIVVTSLPSLYFDRERCEQLPNEEQFPNYVFGDGAAAAVVSADRAGGGVIRATSGYCDPGVTVGWTSIFPGSSRLSPEICYGIDFSEVDKSYVPKIEAAIRGLNYQDPSFHLESVDRVYLHQANGGLPTRAALALGIPADKMASSFARDNANTAAACIPSMLALDTEKGLIKRGQRLLVAAIGAGVGYSAAVIDY